MILSLRQRRTIDTAGPSTPADRQLDAMLDSAAGGKSFSTKELQSIEIALRRYLQAARPRAMPRLLLFLYPGTISKSRLKELREVLVDVDILVDPCGRSVCHESVASTVITFNARWVHGPSASASRISSRPQALSRTISLDDASCVSRLMAMSNVASVFWSLG